MLNDISNTMNNDTTENQDTLIELDMLEIGTLKNSGKTGLLKDDRTNISINYVR